MNKLLMLILIFPMFFSCGSDDDLNNTVARKKHLPKNIFIADGSILSFEYDSKDRLIKFVDKLTEKESNKVVHIRTSEISYDHQNKVTKIFRNYLLYENDILSKFIYSIVPDYISERRIDLSVSMSYNDIDFTTEIIECYFDDKNRLIEQTYKSNEELIWNLEYDSKGNLTKRSNKEISIQSEYDNKHGVLQDVNTPLWVLLEVSSFLTSFTINNSISSAFEFRNSLVANRKENTEYVYTDDVPTIMINSDTKKTNTILYY